MLASAHLSMILWVVANYLVKSSFWSYLFMILYEAMRNIKWNYKSLINMGHLPQSIKRTQIVHFEGFSGVFLEWTNSLSVGIHYRQNAKIWQAHTKAMLARGFAQNDLILC